MGTTRCHMVIDGTAARRSFRGVQPENLVLAVLATSPPDVSSDCVVCLAQEVDQRSEWYAIEVTGSDGAGVALQLQSAFERLGIALERRDCSATAGFRPLARACNGQWVEPS